MNTFEELDLISPLQRALSEERYTEPTPIQAQTIPAALDGNDVRGCAQTGTGKTAAFALPILNKLGKAKRKPAPNRPAALILAPTRELALQIGKSFATYGKHLKLKFVHVYGGVSQVNQVRALSKGVHVLVATPGRLLDLMKQDHIKLDRLEVFVLDEADRMFDMGFLPDIKQVIRCLPKKRQSLFFSATFAPNISKLANGMLTDPVEVNVTPEKSTSVKRIKQELLFVEKGQKLKQLRKILEGDDVYQTIVFSKTKRGANGIAEKLEKAGYSATAIHGNKSQGSRERSLDLFRKGKIQVLVATDLAARGIDVEGVTHVVNYDMPNEPESYVHRIGRTGRAGADGIAISFCTADERDMLRAVERLTGQKIPRGNEEPEPGPRGSKKNPSPKSRGERFSIPKKGSKNTSKRKPSSRSRDTESDEQPRPARKKRSADKPRGKRSRDEQPAESSRGPKKKSFGKKKRAPNASEAGRDSKKTSAPRKKPKKKSVDGMNPWQFATESNRDSESRPKPKRKRRRKSGGDDKS